MKLYSYVVEHDNGFAPNPYHGVCTLAQCKYRKVEDETKRRNLVEMAKEGDWVVGTGGKNPKKSAGNGRLIYAMRVEEKRTLGAYYEDKRYELKKQNAIETYEQKMGDNFYKNDWQKNNRFVLIGRQYYYFGRNAIVLPPKFHNIISGRGYRCKFSKEFIDNFVRWIECNYNIGKHGDPCGQDSKREDSTKIGRNKRPSCKFSY